MKTLLFLVLLALCNSASAHATKMAVQILEITSSGDEYLLKLEPQGDVNIPKRVTVHLRFSPKKAAFAASYSKPDFDAAMKVLKEAVANKKPIEIGLMSNKGFNPIKGRPGHYRSEMIQLVNWFGEPKTVCFFHSDRYEVAPK